jgi:hypothetical protein
MKPTFKNLAAFCLALALLLCGCSSVGDIATGKDQDWPFIQAAGGIDVGRPYFDKDRMYLPIDFDPAGRTVTTKPTAFNSGIVCETPRVRIQNGAVLITVRTATGSPQKGQKSHCPPANLGKKVAPGHYDVFYLDPDGTQHQIGAIFI